MSKRKRQTRTAAVSVPELGEVIVRGATDKELRGDGRDISTPEKRAEAVIDNVISVVTSPRLTSEQVRALSDESVDRICGASMRLHPQTALTLRLAGIRRKDG